jgi:hypothetical protein
MDASHGFEAGGRPRDFSRWARDVLGDADLAAGLAKLETTSATGAPVDREELRRHLHARYVL